LVSLPSFFILSASCSDMVFLWIFV
jgi:hypothetical protein